MAKRVFISHISAESTLAVALKDLIEQSFLQMVDVFVSSDEESIPIGRQWLEYITDSLRGCSVEIILCSPKSVGRPWINFEAGAGWVRDIPVIPLCHSGMTLSTLPTPLNSLQATLATDVQGLKKIFVTLAESLGSAVPPVDFGAFIEKVKAFEDRYTFWDDCSRYLNQLTTALPDLVRDLAAGEPVSVHLREVDAQYLSSLIREFFGPNDLLDLRQLGNPVTNAKGTQYEYLIIPGTRLAEILKDPRVSSPRKVG